MTDIEKAERKKKQRRAARVALAGVLLAILCHALPHEIQGPCVTLVKICTGGH